MVEHATCKDSSSNTEKFKFHYCVYFQIEQKVQLVMITANGGECADVVACATNPCDCTTDANCADCQAHGCNICMYRWLL